MVHDGSDVPAGPASLDSVRVAFDEPRLVSDAGLMLTATLADRLGVEDLVNESVWLGYRVRVRNDAPSPRLRRGDRQDRARPDDCL
jgi:hypothetical protein